MIRNLIEGFRVKRSAVPARMRQALIVFAVTRLLVCGSMASPHGTFFLSDINDLLKQRFDLWNRITTDFDLYSIGDARMISRAESIKLNGIRIGPYDIFAKPKRAAGPFTYEVSIETKIEFSDESGREVPLGKAADVKEKITAIRIRPLTAAEYFTPPSE